MWLRLSSHENPEQEALRVTVRLGYTLLPGQGDRWVTLGQLVPDQTGAESVGTWAVM